MNKIRTKIRDIVRSIKPFDEYEQAAVSDVMDWIDSRTGLFRLAGPDVPAKHLVSYCVVVDRTRRSLLLVNHRKAGLWLPTGGHVEVDEDPYKTVQRELAEELGVRAAQVADIATLPLFITVTRTRGAGSHTDVSLWYVVWGDERMWLDPDPEEFSGYRWMPFENILDTDIAEFDPNMHRFVSKLQEVL